jgi:DNA-binding XRE family transcriptional regulator
MEWLRRRNERRSVAIHYKCYYICTYTKKTELSVNMFAFNMTSPAEVIGRLSERMKRRRIDVGLTQRELAARADVSYGSLRLFEEIGKISLEALVKIAFVLEAEAEFEHLFPLRPPKTIDDVVDRPVRQRVRRK